MYRNHNIGIIVPAYNEEALIKETLDAIPSFVDQIIVINDGSTDQTLHQIQTSQREDTRIQVIDHKKNQGLGQSLIDGYVTSLDTDLDIVAIMAGDNQMHPTDLPKLLDKVIDEDIAYAKGNRLLHHNIGIMPRYRYFGNAILTILTKFATGYYSLMDPQSGYTAIKVSALRNIPIQKMTKGYGYNADILCMLNIQGYKVSDVKIQPIYGNEKSKIKLWKYIPVTAWLLLRLFFRRLWQRYVILDFHPLVLFYLFAIITFGGIVIPFGIRFLYLYLTLGEAPQTTLIILIFAMLISFQSILFGIWMDMDYNRKI